MKLTDPIGIPGWLSRATPPAASLVLLFCAIDFLNWQFLVPIRHGGSWNPTPERCFDNAEPLMPLAALIHSHVLCPISGPYWGNDAAYPLYGGAVRLCLYGGVIITWLAARAISGWWAAGIASAFVATSPLLFTLAHQMTPAAVGVALATFSCWLAAEAFRQPKRRSAIAWQIAWTVSAVASISMHAATAWLIAGQALYGIVRGRAINVSGSSVAIATAWLCALVVGVSFIPTNVMASAIIRADVRALAVNIFAFSYPDEWMNQPHMATYLSMVFLLVFVLGAAAARSTILPYLVIAACMQALTSASFSIGGIAKVTSLAYAVPVAAMALGATTEFLMSRRPRMLAFVVPALLIAAQYAAFGRLSLAHDDLFAFDALGPPPPVALARGDQLRLYHDRGHADHLSVSRSFDGFQHSRDILDVPATAPVVVTNIIPYRSEWRVLYAYEVASRDGSWRGFVNDRQAWFEPPAGSCIRQPSSKMRLYERPDVAFREEGHSVLEPPETQFRVIDIDQVPYQPELHVQVVGGPDNGRQGWMYAQAIMRDEVGYGNHDARFTCALKRA
ncbi:MAG: hypothetical protein M3Z41_03180 [Candidatus Eremiobacteraeota bacterium]|nr:hypothetical protein [Candidatus Eremiobacteraeota bacterium]